MPTNNQAFGFRLICAVPLAFSLAIISLALPRLTTDGLDNSWQALLAYASGQGSHFGRDLIFTYGPWGWLHSYAFPPGAVGGKIAWELLFKSSAAFAFVWQALRLRWWLAGPLLLLSPLLFNVFPDTLPTWTVLALLAVCLTRPKMDLLMALVLVVLALFAQIKFTYGLLILSGLGVVTLERLLHKCWRTAIGLPAGFGFGYLFWWSVAGQPVSAIPDFWRNTLEISGGYSQAMSLPASLGALVVGLILAVTHLGFSLALLVRHFTRTVAPFAVFGIAALLTWKQGFTRADGHTLAWFTLAPLIASFVHLLWAPGRLGQAYLACTLALSLVGIAAQGPIPLRHAPAEMSNRFKRHLAALGHLSGELKLAEGSYPARDALRAAVGHDSVDLIGYEQGAALLSGLRLKPRPIFQSYSVYTPRLAALNAAYFTGDTAPDQVLVKLQTIDRRVPFMDDQPALLAIACGYRYEETVADFARFTRLHTSEREQPGNIFPAPVPFNVSLSDTVAWPLPPGRAGKLVIRPHLAMGGLLRSLLYQPPVLELVVTLNDGTERVHRLIPSLFVDGVIVSPWIENTAEFVAFAEHRANLWPTSFQIKPAKGVASSCWSGFEAAVHPLPGNGFSVRAPHLDLLSTFANSPPLNYTGPHSPEVFNLNGLRVVQLHAPAIVTFGLPRGTFRLTARYGLRPSSFTAPGATDGVRFRVESEADGHTTALWANSLDPVRKSTHRVPQSLDLELPASTTPRFIRLITDTGPSGNGAWDWSYWSEINFSPIPRND